MSTARCGCGKTKRFRGHRRRFTCPGCRDVHRRDREAEMIAVACAGCGRVQRLRPSRIVPCDGYTCGPGACTLAPEYRIPEAPIGWYCEIQCHAAGAFDGWTHRQHTPESLASTWRACEIRGAGVAQFAARDAGTN